MIMKNQKGFTSIEILIALAVLIFTTIGGVVVWEKKIAQPAPTSSLQPTPEISCPSGQIRVCEGGYCECASASCNTDADCATACAQGCPAEGPCPPCPLNRCIKGKYQLGYPSYSESLEKKIKLFPGQTVNLTNTNLSLTLLKLSHPPQNCFDCPITAEIEVKSGANSEKITFIAGVLATKEVEAKLQQKNLFGFRITREELRPEWIILSVQKL